MLKLFTILFCAGLLTQGAAATSHAYGDADDTGAFESFAPAAEAAPKAPRGGNVTRGVCNDSQVYNGCYTFFQHGPWCKCLY